MAVASERKDIRGEPGRAARWLTPRMITIAELRSRIAEVLASLDGPLYVTQRGAPRAVLLGHADYQALTEQLEYLHDSLEAAFGHERRQQGEPTRRWEAVKSDLMGTGRKRAGSRPQRKAR